MGRTTSRRITISTTRRLLVWRRRTTTSRTRSRCSACGRRQIFKDSDSWAREDARRLDDQRHPERAFGLPLDAGLQQHRLRRRLRRERSNGGGWNCALRPAAYLGGALAATTATTRSGGPAAISPNGGAAYFTEPARVRRGRRLPTSQSGRVPAGPIPQAPGVERNSFRGPRYFNVDATLNKAFGLPAIRGLGNAPKVEIRAGFYNLFNKINLKQHPGRHPERALRRSAGRARRADDRAAGEIQFLIGWTRLDRCAVAGLIARTRRCRVEVETPQRVIARPS